MFVWLPTVCHVCLLGNREGDLLCLEVQRWKGISGVDAPCMVKLTYQPPEGVRHHIVPLPPSGLCLSLHVLTQEGKH